MMKAGGKMNDKMQKRIVVCFEVGAVLLIIMRIIMNNIIINRICNIEVLLTCIANIIYNLRKRHTKNSIGYFPAAHAAGFSLSVQLFRGLPRLLVCVKPPFSAPVESIIVIAVALRTAMLADLHCSFQRNLQKDLVFCFLEISPRISSNSSNSAYNFYRAK